MRIPALCCSALLLCGSVAAEERPNWTERIEVHGFLSFGYLESSENNYLNESSDGSYDFNEIALNVGSQLGDDLRIGAQLFVRELGALGNYDLELDWAYLDWRYRDWLGVRAGRVKMPHGLYNETADVDAVRTSVLLPQSVYRVDFRDFLVSIDGAALYGYAGLGAAGALNYQAQAGRTRFDARGSVARAFSDSGAFTVDEMKSELTTAVALIWEPPLPGLRLGATHAHYTDGRFEVTTHPALVAGFGFPPQTRIEVPSFDVEVYSAEYSVGRYTFAAEDAEWDGDFINPVFGSRQNFGGWYVQASARIDRRFEIGSYYSVYYPDLADKDGEATTPSFDAYQKDTAVSLRVDLTRRWIAKLEYHDIEGTGAVLDRDNPSGKSEEWDLIAAKISFAF